MRSATPQTHTTWDSACETATDTPTNTPTNTSTDTATDTATDNGRPTAAPRLGHGKSASKGLSPMRVLGPMLVKWALSDCGCAVITPAYKVVLLSTFLT